MKFMKIPNASTVPPRIRLGQSAVTGASAFGLILGLLLILGINPVLAEMADLILTAQDDGKIVNALVDQRIFVRLEGNPSTGYSWSFAAYGDAVVSTGAAGYTPYAPGVPGGSGLYSYPFKAMKAGGTLLEFQYRRSNDQQPDKTFSITIRVSEEIQGPHLILTSAQNGKTIDALVGTRILVQLDAWVGTGAVWVLITTNGNSVVPTGEGVFTADPQPPGTVGGTGFYSFPFQAMKEGTTFLKFGGGRPWDPQFPIETFQVTIRVAKPIEGPHLILTTEQDGRTVDTSLGMSILVQIEGASGTPYTWSLASTSGDSVVSTGNGGFIPDFPNMPGSGGIYKFPFKAVKEGTTVINFSLCNVGNCQDPVDTYQVTIRVFDALILTAEDNGRTVQVSVGRRILVELEGISGVLFRWIYTANGDSVVSTGFEQYTPYVPGVVVGIGIYSYPFQALKLGTTQLAFACSTVADPGNPSATFGVTIQVVGPRLSITRVGPTVEVRWSMASSYGYYLEATGKCSPPHWASPNVLVVPDGVNFKAVFNIAGESLFFRLSK
jgi:predicted secreted protein